MKQNTIEYIAKDQTIAPLYRAELWTAPFLIIIPLFVSIILIWDWFVRGFSLGVSIYDGELMLAMLIFSGNILCDIPFLKSLKTLQKEYKK